MLETVSLEEAQASLPDLIERLQPGVEIVITRDHQPVAALHAPSSVAPQPRFGGCRGALTILVEDDEHPQDFQDYLP
jgi:antitoxin (DNA-binding transcriptional repressor) of toxin-antitoxin stability system